MLCFELICSNMQAAHTARVTTLQRCFDNKGKTNYMLIGREWCNAFYFSRVLNLCEVLYCLYQFAVENMITTLK